MLTKEQNELLCQVGPATPMGQLMRQYWIPALLFRGLMATPCACGCSAKAWLPSAIPTGELA
jgi:hypothetical protein